MTDYQRVINVYNDRLEIHDLILNKNHFLAREQEKLDKKDAVSNNNNKNRIYKNLNLINRITDIILYIVVPVIFLTWIISVSISNGSLWYEYLVYFIALCAYLVTVFGTHFENKNHILDSWQNFLEYLKFLLVGGFFLIIIYAVGFVILFIINFFSNTETIVAIFVAILLILSGFLIGLGTIVIAYLKGALFSLISVRLKKQLDNEQIQTKKMNLVQKNELGNNIYIQDYLSKINTIVLRMNEYNPFPEKYSKWDDVQAIFEYFRDKRVDTIKEAINLRATELNTAAYQAKMHEELRKQTEIIQQSNHSNSKSLKNSEEAKEIVNQILQMTSSEHQLNNEYRSKGIEKLSEIKGLVYNIKNKI